MSKPARWKPVGIAVAILVVLVLAWTLRWHAVTTLNVDYDEDDYLRAAQQFAGVLRTGDWVGLVNTNYRPEHPPLIKILYGVSLLPLPEQPILPDRPTSADPDPSLPQDQLRAARSVGAVLGTITVFVLALINPLAGLLLAMHSFTIKYVSQVMLEALPALTSLITVGSYIRWKNGEGKRHFAWLLLSALFLGITAASKYMYSIVGLAILLDWFIKARTSNRIQRSIPVMLAWGGLAVVIFFLADPYLWPDPIGRLSASLLYHAGYATGASEVQNAGYPLWQPLVWLNTSPYSWQPVAFPTPLDPLITLAAAFGLAGLWKKERVYIFWLGGALLFLFLWPTKWPQYILVLTAPICLAAAEGLNVLIFRPVSAWFSGRGRKKEKALIPHAEVKRALPWLVPGLIAFVVLTLLPLLFQLAVSLTDFNSISIKDGLQGGIFREVWGGLTGQIHVVPPGFPFRSKTVHFLGPFSYLPLLDYITGQGILVFNLLWMVISLVLQTSLGLGIALLLRQRSILFRGFWQILFILPWAIPEMIGAVMWVNVFNPDTGWLALAVQANPGFPFAFLLGWTDNLNLLMIVLLIAGTWYGFPFMMLVSMTALKMVPKDAYDAAAMDGANALNTFRFVTFPLLLPLLLPAIIIRGIFAFNQFYLFQAFRYGSGTLATLSYNFFNPSGYFINGQFALSAVLNILTLLILIGFVGLFNRWSKAGEGVTYA